MTRLQRLQRLLGPSFTPADMRHAFERNREELRAAGGTSWTIDGLELGEFDSRADAEKYRDQNFHGNRPAREGPASIEYIQGLQGGLVSATLTPAADDQAELNAIVKDAMRQGSKYCPMCKSPFFPSQLGPTDWAGHCGNCGADVTWTETPAPEAPDQPVTCAPTSKDLEVAWLRAQLATVLDAARAYHAACEASACATPDADMRELGAARERAFAALGNAGYAVMFGKEVQASIRAIGHCCESAFCSDDATCACPCEDCRTVSR